jgi:hypothetical protein
VEILTDPKALSSRNILVVHFQHARPWKSAKLCQSYASAQWNAPVIFREPDQ